MLHRCTADQVLHMDMHGNTTSNEVWTHALARCAMGRRWKRSVVWMATLVVAFGAMAQTHDLPFYLSTAEKNSPLLKDFANQLEAQHLDSLLVAAGFRPQVGVLGGWLYSPTEKKWGYDEAITNGGLYSATINANVPLFNHGIRNGRNSTIDIQGQRVRTNVDISIKDLKQSVADQYVIVYGNQRALEFTRSQLQLVGEQRAVLATLADRGLAQETDLLAMEVNERSKRITVQRLTATGRNDLLLLNQLCGHADTASVQVETPARIIPLRSDLHGSPVMRAFVVDSLANLNAARLVDLNYRPQVSAFVNGGLNANNPQDIPYRFGGSLGLNLAIPIYDGGQRRLQHDKLSLQEKTRIGYRDRYNDQLAQRHGQLTEGLQRAGALTVALQGQSADEERLIALYRAELEQGLLRLSDLFVILDAHTNTLIALVQAETDQSRIVNQITYLK